MTQEVKPSQATPQATESKPVAPQSEKDHNMIRLRQIAEATRAENEQLKAEIEKVKKLAQKTIPQEEEDDDNDEPYVDHKRLEKKFSRFEQRMDEKIDEKATVKAQKLFEEYQEQQWLKTNPDFDTVMEHAERFAEKDPELAETILKMPKGFERNKLVYKTIKAMGLHKPDPGPSAVQQRIEQNRRAPFYQPSDISNAPFQTQGDFSDKGKESAYKKMKEMQSRLRI